MEWEKKKSSQVSKMMWDSKERVSSWELRGVDWGTKPVESAGGLHSARGAQV